MPDFFMKTAPFDCVENHKKYHTEKMSLFKKLLCPKYVKRFTLIGQYSRRENSDGLVIKSIYFSIFKLYPIYVKKDLKLVIAFSTKPLPELLVVKVSV